jgi:alpha-beta hydrolase superfamily lysophospholipase
MEKIAKNSTIFIHGQESSSQGNKAVFFRGLFPEMIIPDFVGDVSTRMLKLNEILIGKKGIIMIGSSLGGLMASLYAFQNQNRLKKLILLAPAINLVFPGLTFTVMDDDHRLSRTFTSIHWPQLIGSD